MGKYKVEISGINTKDLICLNPNEMKELFVLYKKNHDEYAREMLISGNMKLVLSILKRFYNKSENLDDLFQIGCVGLIKAIDNFDLSYDVMFSTYAVPMILGEIKRYIRDSNTLKISRSVKDVAYKALKMKEEYYLKYGVEPSLNKVASELNLSEYEVSNALVAMKSPISMYEAIYNDGGDTIFLYDQIEDKKSSKDLCDQIALNEAIDDLKEREQFILEQRFVMGKSQMEIADELDISQAQVSRLEKKAIKELKKVLK